MPAGAESDEAFIWFCSCSAGGVVKPVGTSSADDQLGQQVAGHLLKPGNQGHAVRYGHVLGTARLDDTPRPVIWTYPDDDVKPESGLRDHRGPRWARHGC